MHIREHTGIFIQKAIQVGPLLSRGVWFCIYFVKLRDIWLLESLKHGNSVRIDVLSWLNKMTLDVIGLAGVCDIRILIVGLPRTGFNYNFEALSNKQTELNDALAAIFKADSKPSIIPMLKTRVPFLRFLVSDSCSFARSNELSVNQIAHGTGFSNTRVARNFLPYWTSAFT